MIRILGQTASLDTITPQQTGQIKGLLDYRTTKFENDANRPSCFQGEQVGGETGALCVPGFSSSGSNE